MLFRCTRLLCVIALSSALLAPDPASAGGDDEDGFEKFGDIMQILLPASAGLSTFLVGNGEGSMWDVEGTKQYAKAFGTAWTTAYALKVSVQKMRPDQGARSSFPSGHTMAAFSGASFFGARYGWKYGVPTYALAALTGASRVSSSWHFADDVVAGASISMLSTWLYTSPHHSRIQARPTLDRDGGVGLAVTINGPGRRETRNRDQPDYRPMADRRFRYGFTFGPAFLIQNEISSPADGGTTFDLESFQKRDDPTTTALAAFDWFVADRWTLNFFYAPFETQDNGQFSDPVSFAGNIFPADTPIESAWRLHDLRTRATFDWIRGERFGLGVGAGVIGQLLHVRLTAPGVESRVDNVVVLPYLHARASYSFFRRWSLSFAVGWMDYRSDTMFNGTASVRWQIDPRWEMMAGYQFYDRDIDTSELRNRVSYDLLMLGFAHSWR